MNSMEEGGYEMAPVMSVKDWLVVSLVMLVPIINLVMLFVWGFGDTSNPNKANWAKASLVMMVIGFTFYFTIFALIMGTAIGASAFS